MKETNDSFVAFQKDFDPIDAFIQEHDEEKLSDPSVKELHALADDFINKKLTSYELSVSSRRTELARLKTMKEN